jgi:uncharacterized protein YciI
MPRWVYSVRGPLGNLAMDDVEKAVWDARDDYLRSLFARGVMVMVGPTYGSAFGGIAVFDAPDKSAAQRIMEADPAVAGGYGIGDVRRFHGYIPPDAGPPGR